MLLFANRSLPVGLALATVAISLGAWLYVFRQEMDGNRVDIRVLTVAIGALMVAAVALPPITSHDLWSYQVYGRMISHYGVSPYSHVPSDFPHDPFVHLVANGWRHTPSIYGPVFAGYAAIGGAFAGSSTLLARLFYEAGAAVAVAIALRLIWRRTGSPAAVMLLGLNPLVIMSAINGGHNDAFVGLGVLAAVLLTEQRRLRAAGLVLGVAVLIKATALLALPALVAWTLVRSGRRAAAELAGVALASVAVGYGIAGPAAISALHASHQDISRASAWQLPRLLIGSHSLLGLAHATWLSTLSVASIAVVVSLSVAVAWRRRNDGELAGVVALALIAYLVAGSYVLAWYAMWTLPVVCLVRRRAITVYVASLGAFITAVYVVKYRAFPSSVGAGWHWAGAYVGPLAFLIAYLCIAFRRPPRRPGRGEVRAKRPRVRASNPSP
ncbi:MAG: glycosyltransferase 87 family protein [Acidimicrobiia bacterium]